MRDLNDLPDWCRELVMTNPAIRFLYDDCRDGDSTTSTFYKHVAHILYEQLKVRQ